MPSALRVAFRVDASTTIGTGHLKRCLSLAQALTAMGAQLVFVCRPLDSVAAQVLAKQAVAVRWLPAALASGEPVLGTDLGSDAPPHAAWVRVPGAQDAQDTVQALLGWKPDWVVVDHYAFDARWHKAVRDALACRLVVVDDTADRSIDADALLDHNWHANHRHKYAGRLQREPEWLCGPRYALLSSAYRHAPRYVFNPVVRSVGIFMGGTDPGGASVRALRACRAAGFTGPVEVVTTTASPHLQELQSVCATDPEVTLRLDEPDLAALFARHDLQIGAGGGATWERCCIGAPTVSIAVASNQAAVVSALASLGAVGEATEHSLADVLRCLISNPARRQELARAAANLVDGLGAQRVAIHLLRDMLQLRPATMADAQMLLKWRNHVSVREVSGKTDLIDFDAHQAWMQGVLRSQDRWLFVALVNNLPVGSIRFDHLRMGHLEVSLYTDPLLQGLGLGPRMLFAGERQMHQILQAPCIIHAVVVAGNAASQKIFKACGYHGGPLQFQKCFGSVPTSSDAKP